MIFHSYVSLPEGNNGLLGILYDITDTTWYNYIWISSYDDILKHLGLDIQTKSSYFTASTTFTAMIAVYHGQISLVKSEHFRGLEHWNGIVFHHNWGWSGDLPTLITWMFIPVTWMWRQKSPCLSPCLLLRWSRVKTFSENPVGPQILVFLYSNHPFLGSPPHQNDKSEGTPVFWCLNCPFQRWRLVFESFDFREASITVNSKRASSVLEEIWAPKHNSLPRFSAPRSKTSWDVAISHLHLSSICLPSCKKKIPLVN